MDQPLSDESESRFSAGFPKKGRHSVVVVLPPLWWVARMIWLACRRKPQLPMSFLDVIDIHRNDAQRRSREGSKMHNSYIEIISLIERVHRHFLEVVKLELDGLGIHDINNVQGLLLFNIGDAELTVGELTSRGCYLGSNVSYNLKKMVEHGYLSQERSVHDRRSIRVRLTEKGAKLCGCTACISAIPRC